MASQTSPTTSRKIAWEAISPTNAKEDEIPLLAKVTPTHVPVSRAQSAESPLKAAVSSSNYFSSMEGQYHKIAEEIEASSASTAEMVATATIDPATDAYHNLIAGISRNPKGAEFLRKIDQPLFQKMSIEFFSKKPVFNPNQEIQIEQSGKYNVLKNYVSNKLAVGEFKYKVLTWSNKDKYEGTFALDADGKSYLAEGKITFANGVVLEGTFALDTNGKLSLVKGKKTWADGDVLEGTFDANRTCSPSDASAVITAAQQAVEKSQTLVQSLQEKYRY